MRHVPGQHRPRVVGLPMSAREDVTRRAAVARGVNQQSYGGPITIRRALISHNAPFFFSSQSGPRLATIGRVARGRQWRLGKVARTDRLSRFLNKFSMIFEGTKLVLPIRPLRVLYDKNLIRKDETFKVFAGDQLFIRCGRSAPCVTLFAFYTCSLRHKTTPFSAKSIRRNHGWTILTI